MKNIIGFGSAGEDQALPATQPDTRISTPVRSIVEVRFLEDGKLLSYYNDRFNLKVGDIVFVSGKYAGKMGIVNAVTTKFKINLANYQKIIACPVFTLSGTFNPMWGMMVSADRTAIPSAEMFRDWVKPPLSDEQETEIIYGDGYSFDLDSFETDGDVNQTILERALDYCKEGKIRYLSINQGIGTAFVEGTLWYEVNFVYHDGKITEMYCDCPYPGLCKHNLAVLLMLRALLHELPANTDPEFAAVEQQFFWKILSITKQPVTV